MFYFNADYISPLRFDLTKLVDYKEECHDVLNSFFLEEIDKLPVSGRFPVGVYECRPDTISYLLYGSTQYWWIILLFNGLVNNEDVKAEMTISYPSLSDLDNLYFKLNALQASIVSPSAVAAGQATPSDAPTSRTLTGRQIFGEVVSGLYNGVSAIYTLANVPVVGTIALYYNGERLDASIPDYSVIGKVITMICSIPGPNDVLEADYITVS